MAFPETGTLDAFDSGAVGAVDSRTGWKNGSRCYQAADGSLQRTSTAPGYAYNTAGSGVSSNVWNTQWADAECWVQITSPVWNTDTMRLFVRIKDTANGGTPDYYSLVVARVAATDFEVYKCVAGTRTLISSTASRSIVSGDAVGISIVGDRIRTYHRTSGVWTNVHDFTDGTHSGAGYIGVSMQYNGGTNIDVFGGGAAAVPVVHDATFASDSSSASTFNATHVVPAALSSNSAGSTNFAATPWRRGDFVSTCGSGSAFYAEKYNPARKDVLFVSDSTSVSDFNAEVPVKQEAEFTSASVSTSAFLGHLKKQPATFSSACVSTSAFGAVLKGKHVASFPSSAVARTYLNAEGIIHYAQVTVVSVPIQPEGRLGCGQPAAEVWTRGGGGLVLALPGLTSVSWSRVLGDTSSGEVTLAGQSVSSDPACCEVLREVRPWKHELHIYRDNELQWCGPITEITAGGDSVTLKARDLSAWLDHRFVHDTHIYGGVGANQGDTDTTTIFSDLVTDALAPDTSPNIALDFGEPSGVFAQGAYTPASFKTVGPLIRELAKGSIDWYQQLRLLRYTGGGVSTPNLPSGGMDVTALCVANPSFEVNTANWTPSVAGWSLARDLTQFKQGTASGKMSTADGTPQGPKLVQPLTALIVGKTYTASVWVRGGTLISHWWAFWGSCDNNKMAIRVGKVQSSDVMYKMTQNPTVWYQMTVTFKATSTVHNLEVITAGTSSGEGHPTSVLSFQSFYVDAVQLVLNDPDAAPVGADPALVPELYLTDEALAVVPAVTLAGLAQENRSIVSAQQSGGDVAFYGEAPQPKWTLETNGPGLTDAQEEYGLLETAVTATVSDSSGADSRATQRNAQLTQTPVVLTSLALGPGAGMTMDELLPGALVGIRLDRICLAVNQVMMLRQVDVKTSPGGGEQVTLTVEPVGGGSGTD